MKRKSRIKPYVFSKRKKIVSSSESESDQSESESSSSSSLLLSSSKMNDNELIEVLLRLPVESVHRFKCVCKSWFSLISDSYFIRRYIQHHKQPDSMVLLFGSGNFPHDETPVRHLVHVSPISPDYINLFDFSLRFLPVFRKIFYSKFLSSMAILKISNGLILCSAILEPRPHFYVYYVCNPLTKQWVQLPPTPWGGQLRQEVGFICGHDNLDEKVRFAVVYIQDKADDCVTEGFTTWVLSSVTGDWRKYHVHCPPEAELSLSWNWNTFRVDVYKGMLVWYGGGACIVTYNPFEKPENCEIIHLPSHIVSDILVVKRIGESSQGHLILCIITKSNNNCCILEYVNDNDVCLRSCFAVSEPQANSWNLGFRLVLLPGDILCVMDYVDSDSTNRKRVIIYEKSWSRVVELPAGCLTYVYPFVMTPWPTPVPKLKNQNHSSIQRSRLKKKMILAS